MPMSIAASSILKEELSGDRELDRLRVCPDFFEIIFQLFSKIFWDRFQMERALREELKSGLKIFLALVQAGIIDFP